jgi:hypothetical protein
MSMLSLKPTHRHVCACARPRISIKLAQAYKRLVVDGAPATAMERTSDTSNDAALAFETVSGLSGRDHRRPLCKAWPRHALYVMQCALVSINDNIAWRESACCSRAAVRRARFLVHPSRARHRSLPRRSARASSRPWTRSGWATTLLVGARESGASDDAQRMVFHGRPAPPPASSNLADQLAPTVSAVCESLNRHGTVPADFRPRRTMQDWCVGTRGNAPHRSPPPPVHLSSLFPH